MMVLENLTVKFGGVIALDNVSASFQSPVSGIIGPNGAGKTTTMNAISGFIRCTGRILYADKDISGLSPHHRTRWGLRRSFQHEQIAEDLSVIDNLRVLQDHIPSSRAEQRFELAQALAITGLEQRAHEFAQTLNTYERRLLDMRRCLMGKPKVVMLDEPGGGLTRSETEHIGNLILKIPELTGATVLVIDHDVDLIRRICSETLVLDFGKRIALGKTDKVLDDPKVKAAYLGIEELS